MVLVDCADGHRHDHCNRTIHSSRGVPVLVRLHLRSIWLNVQPDGSSPITGTSYLGWNGPTGRDFSFAGFDLSVRGTIHAIHSVSLQYQQHASDVVDYPRRRLHCEWSLYSPKFRQLRLIGDDPGDQRGGSNQIGERDHSPRARHRAGCYHAATVECEHYFEAEIYLAQGQPIEAA